MRVSASYNRTRIRIMENAKGEYFLYTRPFGKLKPRWFISNRDGGIMDDSGFTPYLLGTSVMPAHVYIIWDTGKEEDYEQ